MVGGAVEALAEDLAEVNAQLWEVEDALRVCERDGEFGQRFVALARSVYALNDRARRAQAHDQQAVRFGARGGEELRLTRDRAIAQFDRRRTRPERRALRPARSQPTHCARPFSTLNDRRPVRA